MTIETSLATSIGQVRFLVDDTDTTTYDLEDAQITYMLAQVGNNVKAAAVAACRWLARRYAKKVTFDADGLRMDYSKRAEVYAARAKELQAELQGGITSVDLDREDAFHTWNPQTDDVSEYRDRGIIYVRV